MNPKEHINKRGTAHCQCKNTAIHLIDKLMFEKHSPFLLLIEIVSSLMLDLCRKSR